MSRRFKQFFALPGIRRPIKPSKPFRMLPCLFWRKLWVLGLALIMTSLQAEDIGGILSNDRELTSIGNPWNVTADLVIPDGVTLTITPGCILQFVENTGLIVETGGRLNAVGSEQDPILLTRHSENEGDWNGIEILESIEDNLLYHVDMKHGDGRSNWIRVQHSKLTIHKMTWEETNKTVLELDHPSIIIRNSEFPNVGNVETIHGEHLEDEEYLILENNVFGSTLGYNDVIDFSDCKRPGPILEAYDNLFLGGSDDGLDLDGCDAHIEGNTFQNFNKGNSETGTSNAIATGERFEKDSEIVVVRNLFMNCDHAVLLKENCSMIAENNTFVNCGEAAVNFSEWPGRDVVPGEGAIFLGCIFWNNPQSFQNTVSQPDYHTPEIVVTQCLIPLPEHGLGENNWYFDPQFVDPDSDFHVLPTSPAVGLGPNGLDMGAYVKSGATISGEPDSLTQDTVATLSIGGPGITHYQFSINNPAGPWMGERALADEPVVHLSELVPGETYRIYVRGKNSAGRWQAVPSISKSWTIFKENSSVMSPRLQNEPETIEIFGNYPNPFNPSTRIRFRLTGLETVRVAVLDVSGRRIRELAKQIVEPGLHEIVWDGTNDAGVDMPSGSYILRFFTNGQVFSRKCLLMR